MKPRPRKNRSEPAGRYLLPRWRWSRVSRLSPRRPLRRPLLPTAAASFSASQVSETRLSSATKCCWYFPLLLLQRVFSSEIMKQRDNWRAGRCWAPLQFSLELVDPRLLFLRDSQFFRLPRSRACRVLLRTSRDRRRQYQQRARRRRRKQDAATRSPTWSRRTRAAPVVLGRSRVLQARPPCDLLPFRRCLPAAGPYLGAAATHPAASRTVEAPTLRTRFAACFLQLVQQRRDPQYFSLDSVSVGAAEQAAD
mmetsp:Transcript_1532/g.3612  ORF Transcript_1532/g.3612 Transcript_1532/m.3612 type:complete len:252 (-) Transcript_1532:3720-4475(-)